MPPASQTAVTISEKTTSAIQIADAYATRSGIQMLFLMLRYHGKITASIT